MTDPRVYEEIPSSHDTCGQFPADEVAQTFEGSGTDGDPKLSEVSE